MIAEMRHRLFIVAMVLLGAIAFTLGNFLGNCLRPYTIVNRAQVCAERLGISYTIEDGATESLDSFAQCVRGGN